MDSRLAYARLSAGVATASRLPTATRGSNNSYTTSWDTTHQLHDKADAHIKLLRRRIARGPRFNNSNNSFHEDLPNKVVSSMAGLL